MVRYSHCITVISVTTSEFFLTSIFSLQTDLPDPVEKTESDDKKTSEAPKTRRRRFRVSRQATSNSIEVENAENGKATTIAPRAEESIQIVNENPDNMSDRDGYAVFDGPLDPDSNYSGFIEVIGKFLILVESIWQVK